MKNETIVAFAPTKRRSHFGMVGIEIDPNIPIAYIRLAKIWKREEMNQIAPATKQMYSKIKWSATYAEQTVGEHLLKAIEMETGINVFPITTQKNLKEPSDIEKIGIMDQIEMTQLLLSLKQDHKLQYPPKPTGDMEKLIAETEMFTENITEQGTVSYYAPGNETDGLIKALMICCFAGRNSLQELSDEIIVVQGSSSSQKAVKIVDDMNKTLSKILGHNRHDPRGYVSGISRWKKDWHQ